MVEINSGVNYGHYDTGTAFRYVPRLSCVNVRSRHSSFLPGILEVPHLRKKWIVRHVEGMNDEIWLGIKDIGILTIFMDGVSYRQASGKTNQLQPCDAVECLGHLAKNGRVRSVHSLFRDA